MSEYTLLVKKLADAEEQHGLNLVKVRDIPIWRIVRKEIRTNHLKKYTEFNNFTNKRVFSLKQVVINFFLSFKELAGIIISRKKVVNILLAFPRLTKINNLYVDKYTDPMIDASMSNKDVLVLQRGLYGNQFQPRYRSERVVKADFIEVISKVLGLLITPVILIFNIKKLLYLKRKGGKIYDLDNKFILILAIKVSTTLGKSFLIKYLFKLVKPRRLFVVNRNAFLGEVIAAKKLDVAVYELQHGVTQGDTILYSGSYEPTVDPDYFLTFGKMWIGLQFGIPLDRIINIGWAYKDFLSDKFRINKLESNCVLVTSSPDITNNILNLTLLLSKEFPKLNFYIRLHPQEGLSTEELQVISKTPNIKIDDTSVDSALSILRFYKVIGENSSVLYEALSLGKMVARVNFNGLSVREVNNKRLAGFAYLDSMKDMMEFLLMPPQSCELKQDSIYDDFKPEAVGALR